MDDLCAAAAAFVLLSYLSALLSRAPVGAVPTGPGGEAVSDTYMFVHQTLAGNGTLTARIASFSGAPLTPWAKAGLILEPDTHQGTAYAAVMVTGTHGVRMQYDYTHESPGLAGAASSPRWLRLSRAGDVITGYDSIDGARWTLVGTARLGGLPRTVQIGLFVTSPVSFPAGADGGTPSVATASFVAGVFSRPLTELGIGFLGYRIPLQ